MQDFYRWALTLYTAFGITVRVHLLFFLITIPMCLRLIYEAKGIIGWFDIFMISTGIVFFSVLLHEYGHAFAARWVGGSADEILLWPLGGLAMVEIPHYPKAHAIVTICGPLVNLAIVVVGCVMMLIGGFSPAKALNPFDPGSIYTTPAYHYGDGIVYHSDTWNRAVQKVAGDMIEMMKKQAGEAGAAGIPTKEMLALPDTSVLPAWAVWAYRFVAINWWLFLFNMLLPGYPMDCGRLVHAYLWARNDYSSATITSCYVGLGTAVFLLAVTLFLNEYSFLMLAFFIGSYSYQTLRAEMDSERGAFGYDFSQGYTSLERDERAAKPKQPGPFRRWMDARKARKVQQERDSKAADETRLDELLDKIARQGKGALTPDEQRFMERVSARYRNKQS